MKPTAFEIERTRAEVLISLVDSAPSRITGELAPVRPGQSQAFASHSRFVEQLSHESRGWLSDIIRSNLDPEHVIAGAAALERMAKGLRTNPPLAWIRGRTTDSGLSHSTQKCDCSQFSGPIQLGQRAGHGTAPTTLIRLEAG